MGENEMKKLLVGLTTGLFIFGMVGLSNATIITDVHGPTLEIDFEDFTGPVVDPIGDYYSALGVTFSNLDGGRLYDTGAGLSRSASNVSDGKRTDSVILFDQVMTQTGMDLRTYADNDTTLSAFLGSDLVGSHTFDTSSAGSFIGVKFLTGFDKLTIASNGSDPNGFLAIDNFKGATHAPEPATMLLLGTGLAGLAGARIRRKKKA